MNVLIDYRLIGRRIRACRRQAHLTQAELAERTGVCHQFIGCLERGEGIPSLGTVMSLCSALEIDPNALLLDCYIDNPEASCSLRDLPRNTPTRSLRFGWRPGIPPRSLMLRSIRTHFLRSISR